MQWIHSTWLLIAIIGQTEAEAVQFLIRLIGRAGFIMLIFGFYRVWDIMASPRLKARARRFAKTFVIVVGLSTIFTMSDFFYTNAWLQLSSMTLNVLLMYVLAWYLNKQARVVKSNANSDQYEDYVKAMDELIVSLKR